MQHNNGKGQIVMKFKTRMSDHGFTITELLLAMGISGIVMGSIYSVYYTQQKSHGTQEQVVAMHQNLRVAVYYMQREIRMAGLDPTRSGTAGIATANANSIRVTLDITDDAGTGTPDGDIGDTAEDITYSLAGSDLMRNDVNGAGNELIAENIDVLDFVYLDGAGAVLATPVASPEAIRSVQITLVARTDREDRGYTNTAAYANQQATQILAAQNDRFRRKRLTTQVRCRNLGF